jgi:hypothetical protein
MKKRRRSKGKEKKPRNGAYYFKDGILLLPRLILNFWY